MATLLSRQKIEFLDNGKPRATGGRKATGLTELAGLPKGDSDDPHFRISRQDAALWIDSVSDRDIL
jgi:hypothetical protein